MLYLLDRRGGLHEVDHVDGELLAQALLRRGVPPTSVVAFRNDDEAVVPDDAPLRAADTYTARLIEGYDIEGVLGLYGPELNPGAGTDATDPRAFLHRRLAVAATGGLRMERHRLDRAEVKREVESTFHDVVDRYELAPTGSTVVVGLSGGVDSGSLLMLLAGLRDRAGGARPKLVAATFQDYDSQFPGAFDSAASLAHRLEVEHHFIEPGAAEEVFGLTAPLTEILPSLMDTEDAHTAMYVDHHTTRRLLEVFSDGHPGSRIALGLHATDLVAGLLNAAVGAHEIGSIPRRQVGPYEYVLPLCGIPKRMLHLYHSSVTGEIPVQTTPNEWEFNPTDRNFYYFLADHLQWLWPGVQHWLFSALRQQVGEPTFDECGNCGSSVRRLTSAPPFDGLCDVCQILRKHGWITRA